MPEIPKKIGKYEIIEELGKGNMGVVYKAYDPDIKQDVAIKTLKKEYLDSSVPDDAQHRFLREAQIGRALRHPNIIATYEYGEDVDNSFIAMEYVPGQSLAKKLDNGVCFKPEEIILILTQLLSGLEEAHKKGVIHRDIKPGNIMLEDNGDVRIADFGIARYQYSDVETIGLKFGTLRYMSPEQSSGNDADERSDLFSVGVILYRLITGSYPNPSNSDLQAPSAYDQALKPWDSVIKKALEKNSKERFQSANEFKQALDLIYKPPTPLWLKVVIGSVVAMAGATFFLYSPEPSPISTPRDSAKVLAEKIDSVLDKQQCGPASLRSKISEQATIVSGMVSANQEKILHLALLEMAGNSTTLNLDIVPLSGKGCEALTMLAPYIKENKLKNHGLQIEPFQHGASFTKGEEPVFEVITPEYDGYLYIDYFTAEGRVWNLLPDINTSNKQFKAHQSIKTRPFWSVAEPYGNELLTVIFSDKPLFTQRPMEASNSWTYLSALNQSASELKEATIVANYFVMTTTPSLSDNDE